MIRLSIDILSLVIYLYSVTKSALIKTRTMANRIREMNYATNVRVIPQPTNHWVGFKLKC